MALKNSRTYQHFSSIDSNGLCITQQNGRGEIIFFFEVMGPAEWFKMWLGHAKGGFFSERADAFVISSSRQT